MTDRPEPTPDVYRLCDLPVGTKYRYGGGSVSTVGEPLSEAHDEWVQVIEWPQRTYDGIPADDSLLARAVMAEESAAHERDRAVRLAAEVERLTAELDRCRWALDGHHGKPDPDAPPIPCIEVDATDGRRAWRAMGEDVAKLGDEWEAWSSSGWTVDGAADADGHYVYLIRRTAPEPTTERVPWWEAVGRRLLDGDRVTAVGSSASGPWCMSRSGFRSPVLDGAVEVLRESEDG